MNGTEKLQLVSLDKGKVFYYGEVIMMFNAVKCMYGFHIKFRQKKIPRGLSQFVGKDISKMKRKIFVICKLVKINLDFSTTIDGGEEYTIPVGVWSNSRVKIIGFKN